LTTFEGEKASWIDISNGVILLCLCTRNVLYKHTHTHRLPFQICMAEYDNKGQQNKVWLT